MQFGPSMFGIPAKLNGDREPKRPRPAAQVNDHRPRGPVTRADQVDGNEDKELASPARHEHSRVHEDPQSAELGPPDNLLKWLSTSPSLDHRVKFLARARGTDQDLGLVFGEYASCRAQPGHHISLHEEATVSCAVTQAEPN